MGVGVFGHALDLFLAQTRAGGDGDARVLAGGVVLGGNVEDAVGVDVKGHLDLGNAARRRGNAGQLELAQGAVHRGHGPFALEHVDLDLGLRIGSRGEGLGLFSGNGRVARNHGRGHAAQRFDRESERGYIEQKQVLDLAGQHACLHRRANGHYLVGVHPAMRLAAKHLLDHLLNFGHARLAAHEDHFVDVGDGDAGVGDGLLARLEGAVEQVLDQLFEFGARQLADQVLGPGGVGGDKGQIDFGFDGCGQLDFGLFGGVPEPLQGHLVALRGQVQPLLLLELGNQPLDDALVKVVAAQVGIAVGGLDFDDAFADFKNGDVEGAPAEVVDGDGLVLLFVEAIGQRGRSGLVDDALHVKAGDLAGVLGGLTLGVVEVGGNGDDRLGDGLAEIGFGGLFELLQDHGRDFGRGVLLALSHNANMVALLDHLEGHHLHLVAHFVVAAAHEALDGEDGVLRVGDGLALGHLAYQPFTALGEADNGGGGARTLFICNDFRLAALEDSDARVGGAEIDADNLCHG